MTPVRFPPVKSDGVLVWLVPQTPAPSAAAPDRAVPLPVFVNAVTDVPDNTLPTVTASPFVALTPCGDARREAMTAPRPPRAAARTARRERGAVSSTDIGLRTSPVHVHTPGGCLAVARDGARQL